MRIGIGITTTPNRKETFDRCLVNVHQNSQPGFDLFTYCDKSKKGVAYAKNMCLFNLKDCDHIFLFDDDCWPVKVGWEQYFIESLWDNNHQLYLNSTHQMTGFTKNSACRTFKECGGVMMHFTKKVIETVGYMDSGYKLWGFEHAGYSNRIFNAGLNESAYISPNKASDYIKSLDYEGTTFSSLTNFEKHKYYSENYFLFMKEKESKEYKSFKP